MKLWSREANIVLLMSLGFGLVGIDRFLIATLYPVIARELQLNYADIGMVTGALAIAWGAAALFMGNLSDKIGRRRVMVGALVVFSLLIGASGLAAGLFSLVLVRVLMGFADGAYTPVSIATTIESSAPQRHGLNIGIQQMMMPLCGLGLAPIVVSQLVHVIDWRYVFLVFALPGLIVAYLVWRFVPDGERGVGAHARSFNALADWRAVLGYRNIQLGGLLMLCWLTCLICTSAFLPQYFMDHLGLPFEQMGAVMSAIGLGATCGTILLPWLSDTIGRKPVMVLATIGAGVSLLVLAQAPASPPLLFWALFSVHFFNFAAITLTVGPLCTETVPLSLHATASGLVIAIGELIGGGLGPVMVGHAAQQFGIEHVLVLPIAAIGLSFVLSLATRETHPIITRRDHAAAAGP